MSVQGGTTQTENKKIKQRYELFNEISCIKLNVLCSSAVSRQSVNKFAAPYKLASQLSTIAEGDDSQVPVGVHFVKPQRVSLQHSLKLIVVSFKGMQSF